MIIKFFRRHYKYLSIVFIVQKITKSKNRTIKFINLSKIFINNYFILIF